MGEKRKRADRHFKFETTQLQDVYKRQGVALEQVQLHVRIRPAEFINDGRQDEGGKEVGAAYGCLLYTSRCV